VFSKLDCKILVSFGQIQSFEISDLVMAKVEKVNITVTYWELSGLTNREAKHFVIDSS
jgi:hypothetical protein